MIQLIFFLSVAGLLFILLIAFARRGKAEGAGRVLVSAKRALFTLETELLPVRFVAQIFSREDLEFVVGLGIPEAELMFRSERKRVAILWIDRVTRQIHHLKKLHLGSARFYARLDIKTEVLLGIDFVQLLCTCRFLRLAFQVAGPYVAPRLVTNVAAVAGRVCAISSQSLAFLNAGRYTFNGTAGNTPPQLGS